MAYSVNNIVPITLSIDGVLVFSSSGTPSPPVHNGDWYDKITGMVTCSDDLLDCNDEVILCL